MGLRYAEDLSPLALEAAAGPVMHIEPDVEPHKVLSP